LPVVSSVSAPFFGLGLPHHTRPLVLSRLTSLLHLPPSEGFFSYPKRQLRFPPAVSTSPRFFQNPTCLLFTSRFRVTNQFLSFFFSAGGRPPLFLFCSAGFWTFPRKPFGTFPLAAQVLQARLPEASISYHSGLRLLPSCFRLFVLTNSASRYFFSNPGVSFPPQPRQNFFRALLNPFIIQSPWLT